MPLFPANPAATTTTSGLITLPAAPARFAPANPSSTVSTSLVMMGLGTAGSGQACLYTPSISGLVLVNLATWMTIATTLNQITIGARWGTYAGPATTVAAGSNGAAAINTIASWAQPSAGVLDVASTAGYAASGTIWVATNGQAAQISYTSITGGGTPSFNGCAFVAGTGSATIATGNAVTGAPQNGAAVAGTRFGGSSEPVTSSVSTTKFAQVFFPDLLTVSPLSQIWADIAIATSNGADAVSIQSTIAVLAELLA